MPSVFIFTYKKLPDFHAYTTYMHMVRKQNIFEHLYCNYFITKNYFYQNINQCKPLTSYLSAIKGCCKIQSS